jgi:hypothetical protein
VPGAEGAGGRGPDLAHARQRCRRSRAAAARGARRGRTARRTALPGGAVPAPLRGVDAPGEERGDEDDRTPPAPARAADAVSLAVWLAGLAPRWRRPATRACGLVR